MRFLLGVCTAKPAEFRSAPNPGVPIDVIVPTIARPDRGIWVMGGGERTLGLTRHSGEPGEEPFQIAMLMRWKVALATLLALSALAAGCKQHCFMTECDYDHYRSLALPR